MTTTEHLVAVKAALDGARAAYAHSPNSDTERAVRKVERDLDRWLDKLLEETKTCSHSASS